MLRGVLVAVAVYGDDAVGVLIYDRAARVHTEGADKVAEFFGSVNDLRLVKLVGQVREDLVGKLNANADVNAVRLCGDLEVGADLLHPLASRTTRRDDADGCLEGFVLCVHAIAALDLFNVDCGCAEIEIDRGGELVIEIFEHDVVDVRAEVADGSVKQVQAVLQTFGFEAGVGGGIELCALAAVREVDGIDIVHQVDSLFLANVFVQSAAEFCGYVVFTVRKCARAAKAVHYSAGLASDAGFDLLAVDGALALRKGRARLEDCNLFLGAELVKLISRKNTAGSGTDDYNIIIFHSLAPLCLNIII